MDRYRISTRAKGIVVRPNGLGQRTLSCSSSRDQHTGGYLCGVREGQEREVVGRKQGSGELSETGDRTGVWLTVSGRDRSGLTVPYVAVAYCVGHQWSTGDGVQSCQGVAIQGGT